MAGKSAERPSESAFTNGEGLKIFCKYWYPDTQDVRALVHVIHGLGEHVARYDSIAATFTKMGCVVFGHDHIGHGRSEGARVDVNNFQEYVTDCFQHVDIMAEKYPECPIIIFGHSMGGTVAILTMNAAPNRFAGAIFGSPCTRIDPAQATPIMVFLGKMVAALCPQVAIARLDRSNLSRDPAVRKDYETDPLVWHGGVKARFARELMRSCEQIQAECHKATYPFLLQHGTKDTLCDIVGSDMFYEKAASKDKVYKKYEGYFHELDKEPEGEREIVIKDIEDWARNLLNTLGSKGKGQDY